MNDAEELARKTHTSPISLISPTRPLSGLTLPGVVCKHEDGECKKSCKHEGAVKSSAMHETSRTRRSYKQDVLHSHKLQKGVGSRGKEQEIIKITLLFTHSGGGNVPAFAQSSSVPPFGRRSATRGVRVVPGLTWSVAKAL